MQNEWESMIDFYRNHQAKYGVKLSSMIKLIERIQKNKMSELFYPSNSHTALGISTKKEFDERRLAPMVYILASEETNTFRVDFQSGQGKTIHEKEFGFNKIEFLFDEIKDWLKNA